MKRCYDCLYCKFAGRGIFRCQVVGRPVLSYAKACDKYAEHEPAC
jgi:hypothetical protein